MENVVICEVKGDVICEVKGDQLVTQAINQAITIDLLSTHYYTGGNSTTPISLDRRQGEIVK